jgi:hypothetical protein
MGHVELDARHSSKLYEIIISRRLLASWGGALDKLVRSFSNQHIV